MEETLVVGLADTEADEEDAEAGAEVAVAVHRLLQQGNKISRRKLLQRLPAHHRQHIPSHILDAAPEDGGTQIPDGAAPMPDRDRHSVRRGPLVASSLQDRSGRRRSKTRPVL